MHQYELFSTFWYGEPLSALHWACLASFVDFGHRVDLYAYQHLEVPEGVNLLDASQILPSTAMFFFKNPILGVPDISPFSDVFRFKFLLERGGWWVDTDVICNTTQFPECQYAWADEFHQSGHTRSIGTSQIKFPKNDPIIEWLHNEASGLAPVMSNRQDTGVRLISHVVEQQGTPDAHFGSTEQFYPIEWVEAFKLWLPECREEVTDKTNRACFIACWASLARNIGLDLNREPPRGSYMADIFGRFAPGRSHSHRPFAASEVIALVRKWFRARSDLVPELEAVTAPSTMKRLGIAQVK